MKTLVAACIMFLVMRSEFLTIKAQLFLGQYPITLENMQVVDSDVEEDLVRVDFHIGISPEQYDNFTKANDVSIRAQPHDTVLDPIEVPLNGLLTQSNNDVYFSITSFNENVNYTTLFQSVNNTGQSSNVLSDPFSLLTTSVQRIATGFINCDRATILCHFLPGTKSDGCLVQWQKLGKEGDKHEVLTQRNATESTVTALLSSLEPSTSYVVEAFSLLGGERLHSFGIPLEHNLVTPSSSLASKQPEIRSIALGVGISLFSVGLICVIIGIVIVWSIHKHKSHFDTMPGTRQNDQNREPHSYITLRGGTNVDDIALQLNVCYTSLNPDLTDTNHQESAEQASLYLYDDIIVVSQSNSTDQQHRQNPELFAPSVALPVKGGHGLHLKPFETASESSENDSTSLQVQSPDYVISSISSVVLENIKKTSNVHRFEPPTVTTPEYENVDPVSGVPVTPHRQPIVRSEWTTRSRARDTEQPERATLPFAGVHVQQRASNSHAATPVIEPAEYEEPVATLTRGQKLKKIPK